MKTYDAKAHMKEAAVAQPPQIKVGDKIPDVSLIRLNKDGQPEAYSTLAELSGKRVVLFMVPGPFTPTCSKLHLPSFVEQWGAFAQKGVEKIVCVAVNTPDVLAAWAKQNDPQAKIQMMADFGCEFVWKMGLALDASGRGLGLVAKRACLILENGQLKDIVVEDNPSLCGITSATTILQRL